MEKQHPTNGFKPVLNWTNTTLNQIQQLQFQFRQREPGGKAVEAARHPAEKKSWLQIMSRQESLKVHKADKSNENSKYFKRYSQFKLEFR